MSEEKYGLRDPQRFRKLDLPTWEHVQPHGGESVKLLCYYWFGVHSSPFGILRCPDGYACVDLQWSQGQLDKARGPLEADDLLWRDKDLIVLVRFLSCNGPNSSKVVTQWRHLLSVLPDSPLYGRLAHRAAEWLPPDALAFLAQKIQQGTIPDMLSETVSHIISDEVATQGSGIRVQDAGNREQGAGVRVQGGRGGEGQGTGPAAAAAGLRSASPLEAASLRPASTEVGPTGKPKAASNGRSTEASNQRRTMLKALSVSFPVETEWLTYVTGKYPAEDIEAIRPDLWPANGRCQGLTKDRTECTRRALAGSPYCHWHQGQAT